MEQKALNDASELRYRTLFQQSGNYIFVMEVNQDVVPVMVEADNAALQAHGSAREEANHRLNNSGLSLFTVIIHEKRKGPNDRSIFKRHIY